MWKELGSRKVKIFEDEEELRRKKEEEERRRREAANKPGMFSRLVGELNKQNSPSTKDSNSIWNKTGRK